MTTSIIPVAQNHPISESEISASVQQFTQIYAEQPAKMSRIACSVSGPKGEISAHDWCAGFMLTVEMNKRLWNDVLKATSRHRHLMTPILIHRPFRVKGKDVTLDEPSILADWRNDIPENTARLREIFQFKRFGTPHPNALHE